MARKKKRRTSWLSTFATSALDSVNEWCRGRMWLPRALLLAFLAYIAFEHLTQPQYQDVFKGLNLGIHEMGHYVFAPFGEFIGVCGGSLLQCLAPIAAMFMFLRQRDYFAIAFAWGWLATSLYDLAVYIGDATAMELPLVSPGAGGGGDIIHDWNYILSHLNMLQYDHVFEHLTNFAATASMLICLTAGGYMCYVMATSPKEVAEAEQI